ncbi:MAG: polysaccharide deacetylase family protein [Burkholderiaceae bacterium]
MMLFVALEDSSRIVPRGGAIASVAPQYPCAMIRHFFSRMALLFALSATTATHAGPLELHQRLANPAPGAVALTLDACGGAYDKTLIDFLVKQQIPATIFATQRWIKQNPQGVADLRAHPQLFQIENHGARHVPAVLGEGRHVFGIAGAGNLDGLRREVQGGADAVAQAFGRKPLWYRGATALYDREAIAEIQRMGFMLAGFSINADVGATLGKQAVLARLGKAQAGDVIIAHMNHPASHTAEALMEALPQLQARGLKFVKLGEAPLSTIP